MKMPRNLVGAGMGVLLFAAAVAPAASSIDLGAWTAESYPAVSGFGAGVWTVAPGGGSVIQSVNGQPTLFYSPFNAQGSDVRGKLSAGGGDDDYIGFALGFRPGDSVDGGDYLLVDWKQGTEAGRIRDRPIARMLYEKISRSTWPR